METDNWETRIDSDPEILSGKALIAGTRISVEFILGLLAQGLSIDEVLIDYPTLVRERQKRERLGFRKWPAFIWATIQALRRYPFLDVRLRVNDKLVDSTTPFVFIGNNEYSMDLFNIGLRHRLDRGALSIYITHRTSRLKLIGLAVRALFGRLRDHQDFMALSSNEVKIQTRHKRLRVAFDGEIELMEPPLEYRVRPRALRVIVPEGVEAE